MFPMRFAMPAPSRRRSSSSAPQKETPLPRAAAFLFDSSTFLTLPDRVVVLLGVDLRALFVLFPVEIGLFALGQMAVMGRHVLLLLVRDVLLLAFQLGRLFGRQFAALDSVGDAVLLVLLAVIHLVDARMAWVDLAGASAFGVGVLGKARSGKQPAEGQGSDGE